MPTKSDHLQVLIQFQQWRTDSEDVAMPDPRDITDALDWAIKELSERKNGKTK
ncbi:MAG: hypothetical protein M0T84_01625 [Betaproteobacteria bacterium]|nr:hypothetical protein [Betaproteobacteria bacterium]